MMKSTLVSFMMIAALSCASVISSGQQAKPSPTPEPYDQHKYDKDPCGDPRAESMAWSPVEGMVEEVTTGDVVILSLPGKKRLRVSLVGIGAPALSEPFGRESQKSLADLVLNKSVEVWVNPSNWSFKRKKPSRVVGVVYIRDGMTDANLEQVKSGMAKHKDAESYTMSNYTECQYVNAEGEARAARRGLWREKR